ncbi:MAG: response regulator [Bradymonadia bacterium]
MGRAAKVPILCVDDEPQLLEGLRQVLRRHYTVTTTSQPEEAIALLDEHGPFAVVVADMRMPTMTGLQLLTHARECHPEVTRVLLTGQSDPEDLLRVIEEAGVFRILNKPCPPKVLLETLDEAVVQHNEAMATGHFEDEEALDISPLWDVLDGTHPAIHGAGAEVQQLFRAMCTHAQHKEHWAGEVGALISPLLDTLTPSLLARLVRQAPLTEREERQLEEAPTWVFELLGRVPNLKALLSIVAGLKQWEGASEADEPSQISVGAAVALASRFVRLQEESSAVDALASLSQRGELMGPWYPALVEAVEARG